MIHVLYMDVQASATTRSGTKRTRKTARPPKVYERGPIPYAVSAPNRFWKIRKGLPADQYWKKRYWRRRITGRGDYVMDPSKSFGYRYGGRIGASIGQWLGSGLQRFITGLGSYNVRKNVFLTGRLPTVVNNPAGGGTVIRFQEYLSDVFTSATPGAFSITNYNLNAANSKTFPFLSQIAVNYEQFEIEGLVFEFRSTSADALNSTNTALGSVMMATQYDVADPVFTSKLEMLNYEYSTSVKPSSSTMHMIECDPHQTTINELYTLQGDTAPANTDRRLYFLGRFSIATSGFQGASVNVGELHLTYQVRLLKPKLYNSLGLDNLWKFWDFNTYDDTNPLSTAAPTQERGNLDVTKNGRQIFFPVRPAILCWAIYIFWQGTGAVAWVPPTAGVTNGVFAQFTQTSNSGATVLSASMFSVIRSDGTNNPLTFGLSSTGTLPTSQTNCNIRVLQVNPDFGT